MMPAQIKGTSTHCPTWFIPNPLDFDMEIDGKDTETDPSVLSDIQECFEQINIISDYQIKKEKGANICEQPELCSAKKEKDLVGYVQLDSCDSQPSTDRFRCLGKPEHFSDSFEFNLPNQKSSYSKKILPELNKYSLKQLQVLIEELTQTVEQVSGELVQLLLENDSLQQESDARNIAIEQLLKMTVNVNESDLKPVQMSVVLPEDDDCDDEV